jgi:hypothetical protein
VNIKNPEQLALSAHAAGWTWDRFWRRHWPEVMAVPTATQADYHRLIGRLVCLVAAGDVDGMEPVPDGWARPMDHELEHLPGMEGTSCTT